MTFAREIDTEREIAYGYADGVVTDSEFIASSVEFFNDPRYNVRQRLLMDYTKVEEVRLNAQTLFQVAELAPTPQIARRAILVGSQFQQSLFNFYQICRSDANDGHLLRVFSDRESALAWLNEGQPPEKHAR